MTESCPSTDELTDLLSGALPESRIDSLMGHVDRCEKCQSSVENLEASDPLADQLSDLRDFEPSELSIDCERILGSTDRASQAIVPIELPAEIGPYCLLSTIAIGGMGVVYEARHRRLGRTFALKLLHSGTRMSRAQAERVRGEWRAHGSLVHPNIVGATDAGIVDGQPYLVTERIEGCDLGMLVKRLGPLQPADACELVRQAALGLQYAHQQHVIHRDVKPSNLMLDSLGTVKVLDLGTAQRSDTADRDSVGGLHGTLAFMAPEQFQNPPKCDQRSDIYSLGCTMFHLLSGESPFGNPLQRSNSEVIASHCDDTPRPLAEVTPDGTDVSPPLQNVVNHMLAKSTEDRYQSMSELIDDLTPLCDSSDIEALVSRLPLREHMSIADDATFWQWTSLLGAPSTTGSRWKATLAVCFLAAVVAVAYVVVKEKSWMAASATPSHLSQRTPDPPSPPRHFNSPTELIRSRGGSVWDRHEQNCELRGLVLQPAKLAGVDQWQLQTVAPRGRITDLAWSADGSMLAVASADGIIRVYRWQNDRLNLQSITTDIDRRFRSIDWHPTELLLAAGSGTHVSLIDATTSSVIGELATPGSHEVRWHPHGELLAVATFHGVGLIDRSEVSNGQLGVTAKPTSIKRDVWSFAWSPTGDRLVTTTRFRIGVYSFDGADFGTKPIASRKLPARKVCYRVGWSPSGKQVALMQRLQCEICDPETLGRLSMVRHSKPGDSISFRAKDDQLLLSCRSDLYLIDGSEISHTRTFADEASARPSIAWHPQGNRVAVGMTDTVSIVDERFEDVFRLGANNHVTSVRGMPDRSSCVLTQSGKFVHVRADGSISSVRNISESRQQTAPFDVQQELGRQLFFRSPLKGNIKVSLSAEIFDSQLGRADLPDLAPVDGEILIYDRSEDKWKLLMANPTSIDGLSISPDGTHIACMEIDATIFIISIAEKRVVSQWRVNNMSGSNAVMWHESGRIVMTGSRNNVAQVVCIDPATKRELWRRREPGLDRVVRAISIGESTILHSGIAFKERDIETGGIVRTIELPARRKLLQRLLVRDPSSDLFLSWSRHSFGSGTDASEPVLAWDVETLHPRLSIVGVGFEDWITLTPQGQVIDATPGAANQLVWILQRGSKTELADFEMFPHVSSEN